MSSSPVLLPILPLLIGLVIGVVIAYIGAIARRTTARWADGAPVAELRPQAAQPPAPAQEVASPPQ